MREVFDDDAARDALRTLAGAPAPPVATTLDEVLRRGRRRVFAQRVSAVAGVVAVVAAIGVTAVLLRPSTPGGGVRVVEPTPAPRSTAPSGPLPGWEYVPIDEAACFETPVGNVPGTPPDSLLPQEVVQPAFTAAVESVTGPLASATTVEWTPYSPKMSGPRGYVVAEVPMDGGNGQLQLEAGVYPGTPAQMADASLYVYGDCAPPARHVLADGTVMQLYQRDDHNPEQPMMHLQIHRPDGREYIVTAAGWSEADMVPHGGGSYSVEGGRGDLPTTAAELAEIATRMVANLG